MNFVNNSNNTNPIIIGIDHGYGNIKTAHCCFKTGVAAVARELNIRKLTSARVHLAAGLPLTWVSEQKDNFKAYLLQNDSADFTHQRRYLRYRKGV